MAIWATLARLDRGIPMEKNKNRSDLLAAGRKKVNFSLFTNTFCLDLNFPYLRYTTRKKKSEKLLLLLLLLLWKWKGGKKIIEIEIL